MTAETMVAMWGIGVRARRVRDVDFVCPRCGIDRGGSVVATQRWFGALRIPLVPLARLDDMVECHACRHRSGLTVLEVPTTEALATYLRDATRGSVATMVRASADRHDPLVREAALATMHSAGYAYDDELLAHDVAHTSDDDAYVALAQLSYELTPHGKQSFLHRMATIALADGPISAREQQRVLEIGVALRMAPPHINGVLAVATNQLEAA